MNLEKIKCVICPHNMFPQSSSYLEQSLDWDSKGDGGFCSLDQSCKESKNVVFLQVRFRRYTWLMMSSFYITEYCSLIIPRSFYGHQELSCYWLACYWYFVRIKILASPVFCLNQDAGFPCILFESRCWLPLCLSVIV